ncbi:MAG: pyridoxine 5'-phosphate synthase [Planctomycetes bacterium]|nr:pyridoxine 5'-phosphate synthase [Planctomycetota bacterium]
MTRLSVNLNKVALLRNARDLNMPSVIEAAEVVIDAGGEGITVHPRPDERHIRYEDAYELAKMLTVEYNIEGNPFTGRYMELMADIKPAQATLVPDDPNANTSDHGWDVKGNAARLGPVIKELKALGIRVSLFMDYDNLEGINQAANIGADRVELYTEPYAKAFSAGKELDSMIEKYALAGRVAGEAGLGVNAGHDLNLKNLGYFCEKVPGVLEVSIGHALISEALYIGLGQTVKEYIKILS